MKIEELCNKLTRRLEAQTQPETQRFYLGTLKLVRRFFESLGIDDIDDLTADDVYDFISSNRDLGYSAKTINNKVEVIKKLIRLNRTANEELTEILEITPLRNEPNSFMPMSVEDLHKFITWVKELPTETHDRNLKKKCMFLLQLQNGIRTNEMLELKVADVLIDDNRIKLTHTKCGEVRYAYFDNYTRDLLKEYIKRRKPQTFLFENRITHEKMTPNSYCDLYTFASETLGIDVSSHILRATFATHSARNGCNIESIRIMMGHRNLKTTQRYLHMSDTEIFSDNQKFNPLAHYEQLMSNSSDVDQNNE